MVLDPAEAGEMIALSRRRGELVIGYRCTTTRRLGTTSDGRSPPVGSAAIEHISCLYASASARLYRGHPESYSELFGYDLHGPAPETYARPVAGRRRPGPVPLTPTRSACCSS